MGKNYTTYKNGLKVLKLDSLEQRRKKLCLSFAKKCTKHEKLKDLFQLKVNNHQMIKRKTRKYQPIKIKTERYKKSAIPYMTKLLNNDNEAKHSILKSIK